MAEFLVRKNTNPIEGGLQAGDIVDGRPDGWAWSRAELPNVIKRPDIATSEIDKWLESDEILEFHISPDNTVRTSGKMSLIRVIDGEKIAEIRVDAFPLTIKARSANYGTAVDVKVTNNVGEEIQLEQVVTSFHRKRYSISDRVTKVILDKTL